MAGYRKQPKVYRLRFADDDYAGLEVKARSVPLGTFLELTTLADAASDNRGGREQVEQVSRLIDGFAGAIVEWNLEDEAGVPVPATLAGLHAQEFDFVLPIITAWMDAISGVNDPLPTPSSSGGATLEASLPMAPLSPSPEPSLTPS